MAEQKKIVTSEKGKKKSGCVNVVVVEAGYNGKKWTI